MNSENWKFIPLTDLNFQAIILATEIFSGKLAIAKTP